MRDPTAAGRDEGLDEETRSRVVRALATFDTSGKSRTQTERIERQYAIITRCDLGGQLHKVVASDLGISMRTFYRERLDAFARLGEALSLESGPSEAIPDAVTDAQAEIDRAWGYVAQGRIREAIARLSEVGEAAPAALQSVAFARLSSLWHVMRDETRSAESMVRAKRALALLGAGATRTVVEAEIRASEAERLRCDGAFAAAVFVETRTAGSVHRCTLRCGPNALDALQRVTAGQIAAQFDRGDAARALETATSARSVILADGGEPGAATLPLDVAAAEGRLIVEADPVGALDAASAAHASAVAHSMPVLAARALRVAAHACAALDDDAAGLAHARAALAQVAAIDASRTRTEEELAIAGAFADLGDGESALAVVESCAIARGREDVEAGVARSREAEALVVLGRYREAATRAREAIRILARFDSRRLLGEAMLASARALLGCADPRGARAAASQAAKQLLGGSWPTRAVAAQRLAGREGGGLRRGLDRRTPAHVRDAG